MEGLEQGGKRYKAIVLGVLVLLVLLGLVVFYFQDTRFNKPGGQPFIQDMENSMVSDAFQPAYCINEPHSTEIGRVVYPIAPQYKNLEFLGQLFTAQECGADRLDKIKGVQGEHYLLGEFITLRDKPSEDLVSTFSSLGFNCADETDEKNCLNWQLSDQVRVEDLVQLKPFAEEMQSDDCVNCG